MTRCSINFYVSGFLCGYAQCTGIWAGTSPWHLPRMKSIIIAPYWGIRPNIRARPNTKPKSHTCNLPLVSALLALTSNALGCYEIVCYPYPTGNGNAIFAQRPYWIVTHAAMAMQPALYTGPIQTLPQSKECARLIVWLVNQSTNPPNDTLSIRMRPGIGTNAACGHPAEAPMVAVSRVCFYSLAMAAATGEHTYKSSTQTRSRN